MKSMKWTFVIFNILMLFVVIKIFSTPYSGSQTAAGMGGAIADGVARIILLFIWVAVDIIFGIFMALIKHFKK